LEIVDTLEENDTFARYLIRYPSDGLMIYGFLSVPNEGTRFPVALVLHGYIDPDVYEVETYTTRYTDALVRAGYFVIHPNYRNYPPSDRGPNPFRIGYATDVLNLIGIIREQSQDPYGPLRRADGSQLHVMGHSMGGGAALRVATVWPAAIDAVVLYGAMSGDEARNYERISGWSNGESGAFELAAPAEMLTAISPIYHLDRISAAVSIHHSTADTVVPFEWSEQLCALLANRPVALECHTYYATPHTFRGNAETLFMERMIAFFDRY
jgi:dipeptidyl aminopeptidase/acylaminoacyl peptidase